MIPGAFDWKIFLRFFAVQFVGQALMGGLAWYWLGLGVGTIALVGLNALIAVVLLLGWSLLDAYGLGKWRNWIWAVPTVASMPLMGLHVVAAIVIPFVWLIVLFPSAAAGKWRVQWGPGYLAICLAILLGMTVVPAALLNWIPGLSGLTGQALSFGGRALLAYAIFAAGWALLLMFIGRNVGIKEAEGGFSV